MSGSLSQISGNSEKIAENVYTVQGPVLQTDIIINATVEFENG